MTTIRRCTAAVVAAVALASLAACGDDGESGGDPTTAPEQTQTDDAATEDDGAEDDTSTDDTDTGDVGGEEFTGDVCVLGAAVISAEFQLNDDPPPTTSTTGPHALFDGVSCLWEGSFANELQVDVSAFDDYIPITDSLVSQLSPQPVPELGEESWCIAGTMGDLAWRRDNVSVFIHDGPSCETSTEFALAIDADLKAAGY